MAPGADNGHLKGTICVYIYICVKTNILIYI